MDEGKTSVALVGSESRVSDLIEELAEAGVTDFAPSEFTTNEDERERTRGLLKNWNEAHHKEYKT